MNQPSRPAQRVSHQPFAHAQPLDPGRVRDHPLVGVLAIVEPQVQQGVLRLRKFVDGLAATENAVPFDPESVHELALEDLQASLIGMLGRPVVLELHVARLKGGLEGGTSEERFSRYLSRMAEPPAAREFLRQYPVLTRQVELCINQWVTTTREFLHRLSNDWDGIRAKFCPYQQPGSLASIEVGAGDKHRDGRSVMVATFTSGFKLVYKPRSLAVDVHFQELMQWVNERTSDLHFRTLGILDRGEYGWAEFVRYERCSSPQAVERFYRRHGGLLALLYALKSTDFHYENVIASGEHPVLVDLEALFHPEVDKRKAGADAILEASVLEVGLLPRRILPDGKAEGIDLSGIGAIEGALMPDEVPAWEHPGTDEMRLTRTRVAALSGTKHRPVLSGTGVNVGAYAEEVCAGFGEIYSLLSYHRAMLLNKNGPIARFASDPVRVIIRPTHTYSLWSNVSFHPDMLRLEHDRELLFAKVCNDAASGFGSKRVRAAEETDLRSGDIPLFTTTPGSRDLWTSRGERLPNELVESGHTLVVRRLLNLDLEDLYRQQWLIRASFASLEPGPGPRMDNPTMQSTPSESAPGRSPATQPVRERLIALASAIGDRIAATVCGKGRDMSWIGLSVSREGRWTPAPLGSTLYDGIPGVAIFLAHLGAITGQERFTDIAYLALEAMRASDDGNRAEMTGIGAMDGWGGTIYALAHFGALWKRESIIQDTERALGRIEPLIDSDQKIDLFGGAAGCVLSLLALQSIYPSARTLRAAVRCGQRILDSAMVMDRGIGWASPGESHAPLAGLSHGASGIVLALYKLWTVTSHEPFRKAARQGLAYESTLFSVDAANWADLRSLPQSGQAESKPRYVTAFCHGAPGIGLARLHTLGLPGDHDLMNEIGIAIDTTLRYGWGRNHSLCHGDLGNLDLLLEASLILSDKRWSRELAEVRGVVLDDIELRGWRCAHPGSIESPELMTGLSGIGYELLRLAAPEQVPSVLVLAPPGLAPLSTPWVPSNERN
jgi:type 2 lantibiotic biosynthesis protein LanM